MTPKTVQIAKTKAELTFKYNRLKGRHGWLRLTPAYSVKVVHQILEKNPDISYVLDPFSGTATTGLVCGEHGIRCDLLDINPFLVWFGGVKTSNFNQEDIVEAQQAVREIAQRAENRKGDGITLKLPPISNIERWWPESKRRMLSILYKEIQTYFKKESKAKDLLLIVFCRCLIEWSNAAFNHQSMSFKEESRSLFESDEDHLLLLKFSNCALAIIESAIPHIPGKVRIIEADSRNVPKPLDGLYDCVITSPPYPNRMSYIRELRPYMYWLEYLNEAREAGELDWKAIGGTWGIATSFVDKWVANGHKVNHRGFIKMVDAIKEKSNVLGNYVHKYFVDISHHVESLLPHLAPGAKLFYIVGNSKFYETLVSVEEIYASIFRHAGLDNVAVTTLRKRNSKKELFEYIVSAEKPR